MTDTTGPSRIELSERPSNLTDVISETLKNSADIEADYTFFGDAEHPVTMQFIHHSLPDDLAGIPLTLTLSAVGDERYDPEITDTMITDIDPDNTRVENLTDELAIHTATTPAVGIGYSRLINGIIVKTVVMPLSLAAVTEVLAVVDEWISRCPVNPTERDNPANRWKTQARLNERTTRTVTWHNVPVLIPATENHDTDTVSVIRDMSLTDHREYETDTTLGDLNNTVIGLDIDPFSIPDITEAVTDNCPDHIIGERVTNYFRDHNPGLSVTVYTGPLSH